jgi:hypothetical protein
MNKMRKMRFKALINLILFISITSVSTQRKETNAEAGVGLERNEI